MLEALEELYELLVHQRVHGDLLVKGCLLSSAGKVSMQQQVGAVQEITLISQLLDVVPSVEQDALFAINEGDCRVAGSCTQHML